MLYVCTYLPGNILCAMCIPGAQGGQKKVLDPFDLELQVVVSPHVCVWN